MSGVYLTDGAIGETRRVLFENGRPVRIDIARWSDEGRRARWGDVYRARVRAIDAARGGAFLDLGLAQEQGFLPFDSHGHMRIAPNQHRPVTEGEMLIVRVAREGAREKNPVVAFVEGGPPGAPAGRIAKHERDEDLHEAPPASPERREEIDAAIDEALARTVPLRGGGRLTIERTAALTAIDVDSGARKGGGDLFARDLNMEAAREAVRQLILRSQGGLAAIDFVSMRAGAHRKAVEAVLKEAAKQDHWNPIVAPMSRFGVVELSRAQLTRPIADILLDEEGAKSAETIALETLRAIEREHASVRGRKIVARAPQTAADWLEREIIPWRAALEARIGFLWEIEAGGTAIDVRAV
jgi:Ribonuclease G/E